MVAAARLKRAQDRVQSARPYAEQMRTVMGSLANAAGTSVAHPLLEQRTSIKRIGILAVTADRGLCGSYATNILKKTSAVSSSGARAKPTSAAAVSPSPLSLPST